MTANQDSVNGSFSMLVMVSIVGVCLLALSATGYVKYNVDRFESTLVAPDTAFTPEQEIYEKTIVALGYSGFLGSAQNFMNTRDRAALADMRMNLKTAQETVTRLADKAPAATRRDVKAIMDMFASLIDKTEQGDAMSEGLTNADLLAATSALTTLDTRLQAAMATQRMAAHNAMKMWSLTLMLIAWGTILLAGVLAAAAHYALSTRQAGPIGKLTQCVENMIKGMDQSPIWGLERRDALGELARTLEKARITFTQLPDISIENEDGPVRFKFDGTQKSIFQTMMKNITDHFETAKQSTSGLSSMMNVQQETMLTAITRLNASLTDLHDRGMANEETIRNLAHALMDASTNLALTQENSVNTIGKLVPTMKERIQNMAEVTHLAGQQVTTSLQSMIKAESTLRSTAAQSHQVVTQLSNATNQMGERMFAALNLVQASGKLLSDTTEIVKGRFNDAVDTLGRGEGHLLQIISRAESRLASTVNAEENMAALASRTEASAIKMERAVNSIADRHEGLSEQVVTATHRMEAIVASFDAAQRAMSDATSQVRRDASVINNILAELRANNEQLLVSINQNSQTSFTAAQGLAEKSHALMQRLEIQIQQQAQAADAHIDELATHGKTMAQQATNTTSTLAQTISALKGEQEKLLATRNKFSEVISDLSNRFEQQATQTFGKTESWAAQSFAKLNTIAEQVDSVMQRLTMLGQLTGTLGTVAGQLGQLVPTLTQIQPSHTGDGSVATVTVDLEETKALILQQTEDVMNGLQSEWHKAVVQIEAMHDQLAQLVIQQKDQLETRLMVMDKKIREATDSMMSATEDYTTEEKHTEIINELIAAVSKINEHVMEIDDVIEESGLKKGA